MSDQPFGKRGGRSRPPEEQTRQAEGGPREPIRPGYGMIVVTTNDLPGYRVLEHLGVVRGITVRSRSVVGTFVGGVQSLFGGQIGAFLQLAEQSRQEAYDHLVAEARAQGANAVLAMRYDANEIADGITEVLAYGTAVVVEPSGS